MTTSPATRNCRRTGSPGSGANPRSVLGAIFGAIIRNSALHHAVLRHRTRRTPGVAQRRKRVAGFIFDIDGTLIDSNGVHARAWQDAFRQFGKEIPWEVIFSQIGKGGDLLVPDLLNAREMRAFGKKIQKWRKKHFQKNYLHTIVPFPDVRRHLETIRKRPAKIVLASSSDRD